jgi:hypothetical protein
MILADILFYFLIILGFYLVFQSYWLVCEALFPRLVERCRRRYAGHPLFCLFIGLVISVPVGFVGLVLLSRMGNGLLQIMGIAMLLTLMLLGLIGSTGLCRQIGLGLAVPSDESQPWRRVLRGGLVLGLTFVMPILGWVAIMPLVIMSGVGVLSLSVLNGDNTTKAFS